MRESTFIDKNVKRWEFLEQTIENDTESDPDEISSDFIDLLNDLSYSKTHYPHSKINEYLNSLASRVYKRIYLNQKLNQNPFVQFWIYDFPAIIGHNRKVLWAATVYFLVFCLLGYICSMIDSEFISSILGQDYVRMTEENIKKGEPFGVYKDESPFYMFFMIFLNNIRVGLWVFTFGITLGLGTAYLTFKNAIMVGAFISLFIENNLGFDAIFVIMLHGTFELMGLILECMAGLILGLSFLFPGTLTRGQAFRKGLTESVKIYIGTIPFTFLAAVIESYVTRLGKGGLDGTNLYLMLFLGIIFIGSWLIVIWYFFFYSKQQAQNYPYAKYLEDIVK